MNNTLDFVQVEDDARFTAYCAGLATVLQHRIEKGEQLDEREAKWLRQFGTDQLTVCTKLIAKYTVLQVRERLTNRPFP